MLYQFLIEITVK